MKISELFRYNLNTYKVIVALYFILAILFFIFGEVNMWMIPVILLMYFVYGGLGVATTFHKLLTHRSYQTTKTIERLFSIFGTLGGTGSSIAWVAMHVEHHKHSDKISDPHSPAQKGLRVLLLDYNIDSKKLNGPSKVLLRDPFHVFLHNYYGLVHLTWAVLLVSWGLDVLFSFYIIPMILTVVMSNYIIYFCHSSGFGYRNFDSDDNSRNNLIGGYLVFGEGWHNNHHYHPRNANFKQKWWEFDLAYQVVKLIRTG